MVSERVREERNRLESILMEQFYENTDLTDEEIETAIEQRILEVSRKQYLTVTEKQELKKELYNTFRKLDILSSLLEDKEVSEIMINGYNHIFIEKNGVLHEAAEVFRNEERLHNVIQQIVGNCNRIVNETVPIVDARLADGSRINVVLPPVAMDGAVMTIRKFSKDFFTIDKLIALNTITKEAAHFLEQLVYAKYNIFVSGGREQEIDFIEKRMNEIEVVVAELQNLEGLDRDIVDSFIKRIEIAKDGTINVLLYGTGIKSFNVTSWNERQANKKPVSSFVCKDIEYSFNQELYMDLVECEKNKDVRNILLFSYIFYMRNNEIPSKCDSLYMRKEDNNVLVRVFILL